VWKSRLRIPIPFEIGYIFKALPEALYNSMMNEHGSEEAVKAFNQILIQTIPGGTSMATMDVGGFKIPTLLPIPQAMKPIIETSLGKSFYTGRDILSKGEQQLLPEAQFRENTTEIAKALWLCCWRFSYQGGGVYQGLHRHYGLGVLAGY
jgi:hypothetical protein